MAACRKPVAHSSEIKRVQTPRDVSPFTIQVPWSIFFKEGFEPKSFIVKSGVSGVRITLEPSAGDMVVPLCSKPGAHQRRIGWGKFRLHFDVPKRGVKILGGKPDVDYVRYVIKPKSGDGYLELWFGFYAMTPDPEDEQFLHSVSFQQKNTVDARGGTLGRDTFGKLESGRVWRQMNVFSEGARYEASPENAALFDHIINSACYTPYPGH